MAEPPPDADSNDDNSDDRRVGGERPSSAGMPRWVKVFLIIGLILALVVVIGLLTGQAGPGGRHGPGRHMPSGYAPAAIVAEAHPLGR